MLNLDERVTLVIHCHDHAVAVCPSCAAVLQASDIGTDVVRGLRDFCSGCRADLTAVLREHLADCTWMRVQALEGRRRAREIQQQALETSKSSQQLRDRADVLAGEAEAAQQESREVKRGQPPSGTGEK
jgi:hypothetical protein